MLEVTLDASQLNVYETCPRKWLEDYWYNLETKRPSDALSTGSWFHTIFKHYYLNQMEGRLPTDKRIGAAVAFGEHLATDDSFTFKGETYSKHMWPRVAKDPTFHLNRLREYFYRYYTIDEAINIIGVEKGFSYLLFENEHYRFILEGMIDLIYTSPKLGLVVRDHKTQSRFDEIWPNNHQVMNYLQASGASHFEYNYIGQQDKQNENTFHRQIYKAPGGALENWKQEIMPTFWEMAYALRAMKDVGEVAFPRRRAACDSSKYGLCQYHKLCSEADGKIWYPSWAPEGTPIRLTLLTAYKEKEKRWQAWT